MERNRSDSEITREIDFKAPGLSSTHNRSLMTRLNASRLQAEARLREEAIRQADSGAVVLFQKVDTLETAAATAAKERLSRVRDLGLGVLSAFAGVWLIGSITFLLYLLHAADISLLVSLAVAGPALAVVIVAVLVVHVFSSETLDNVKEVAPLIQRRYTPEMEAEIAYRAASAWLLGSDNLYVSASKTNGNWKSDDRSWEPVIQAIPYAEIKTIEIGRDGNALALTTGESRFVIMSPENNSAIEIAEALINRGIEAGHNITQMSIQGDPMAGLAKVVDADLLERFARTVPGVDVLARNDVMDCSLMVRMVRADQVAMEKRVSEFEGIPVRYVVPVKTSRDAMEVFKPDRPDRALLH